ncbi:MAG: thiamine pyrophosphate-binding protein [Pseudomonadota bacterium]|nr:thiamine pyrophosphate-binding protein [Pseudomonadota bacterium]
MTAVNNKAANIQSFQAKESVSKIIHNHLEANKVDKVFGFSGGAVLSLIDQFHSEKKGNITFITNSNEQLSGFSAAGYAKSTGKVGVAVVSSGPALTNMVTPLLDCYHDGVPIILFSGQVSTKAQPDSFQFSPATDITKSCTKWSYKIKDGDNISQVVKKAFTLAISGRPGPVHIDCPSDLLPKLTNYDVNSCNMAKPNNTNLLQDNINEKFNKLEKLISQAEKPIFYIGKGANNCAPEVRTWLEKIKAPVVTTIHAKGVVNENHPLSLGMVGMHGNPAANVAIQSADLILALGSRFDDRTIGNPSLYAPNAKKASEENRGGFVHVDIRESQNGLIIKPDLFFNMDVAQFLEGASKLQMEPKNKWLKEVDKLKQERDIFSDYSEGSEVPSTQDVIKILNDKIETSNSIITTGVGVHQMAAAQFINMQSPNQFITSGSLGTMGSSLGFAVGAKLGNPEKLVIAIDGDGSFNMSNTELKTLMELKLPVKVLLLNNNSEMMVKYWQKLFYNERYLSTENQNCDYNKLADAYSIENYLIKDKSELSDKMDQWLSAEGPSLLHVEVSQTPCLPLVKPGSALDDMIEKDQSIIIDQSQSDKAT